MPFTSTGLKRPAFRPCRSKASASAYSMALQLNTLRILNQSTATYLCSNPGNSSGNAILTTHERCLAFSCFRAGRCSYRPPSYTEVESQGYGKAQCVPHVDLINNSLHLGYSHNHIALSELTNTGVCAFLALLGRHACHGGLL
jgi:hypothetical protein